MIPEKVLSKVKKLLKLAQSDNLNEANLAMENAHKLIREHGISDAELTREDKEKITVDFEIVPLPNYGYPWARSLFQAISHAYHCEVIFIKVASSINFEKENFAGHLFGTNGDRETVKLMFDFAVEAKVKIAKVERNFIKDDAWVNKSVHMREFTNGIIDGMCRNLYATRIVKIRNQNNLMALCC